MKHSLLIAALLLCAATPVRANEMHDTINDAIDTFEAKQNSDRPIPSWVLQQAKGIGIIEVTKGGLGVAGADGQGVIVVRTPNGWSAPFAFTQGGGSIGFQVGIDIKKYIYVFNTPESWRAFTGEERVRFQAGAQATAGPDYSNQDAARGLPHANVFVYTLSDGAFAGAAIGGQLIGGNADVNMDAYHTSNPSEILSGQVPPPAYAQHLYQTLDHAAGMPDLHAAMRPGN